MVLAKTVYMHNHNDGYVYVSNLYHIHRFHLDKSNVYHVLQLTHESIAMLSVDISKTHPATQWQLLAD